MGQSTPTTAFDGTILIQQWLRRQFFPNKLFVYILDGAFMGQSTPTTAFDGAIGYFAYTM